MRGTKKRIKPTVWQDIKPAKQIKKPPKWFVKLKSFLNPILKSRFYVQTKRTLRRLDKKVVIKRVVKYGIFIATLVMFYIIIPKQSVNTQDPKTTKVEPGLVRGTPTYKTLLPQGKNIKDLGGWIRPGNKSVYVYLDRIDNVAINVSQQPLPEDFRNDVEQQVDDLAMAENATEKITVGSINVYIGTSAKGPQSVFFAKENLLVLIKSASKIENDQWARYINSLQ